MGHFSFFIGLTGGYSQGGIMAIEVEFRGMSQGSLSIPWPPACQKLMDDVIPVHYEVHS